MNNTNSEELAQLRSMVEQLATKVSSQEVELQQLHSQIKSHEAATSRTRVENEVSTSRRRMLKKLGVAAAGLAIAGTAVGIENRTVEAAVDPGVNSLAATAFVRPSSGTLTPTLEVDADQTPLTVIQTSSAALLATANDQNTSTTKNYGIIAVSGPLDITGSDLTVNPPINSSFSLKAAAIQGRSGVASSVDATINSNIGIHGISDGQAGILGQYSTLSTVANSYHINTSTDLLPAGVIGASDNGVGVIGASGSYTGVYAASSFNQGYSLIACRGPHDVNANLVGRNLAPLWIEPSDQAGAPTDNGHRMGEIHVDSAGKLWICAQSGSVTGATTATRRPPEFKRIAPTVSASGSPGTFYQLNSIVFLSTPVRVVGQGTAGPTGLPTPYPNYPPVTGNGFNYIPSYFLIEGTWGGQTIPSNAIGVIGFFTHLGATSPGFAAVYPADTTPPGVSTLNYPGNSVLTTTVITKLGAIPASGNRFPADPAYAKTGKLGIAVTSFTSAQVALDVVAYIV